MKNHVAVGVLPLAPFVALFLFLLLILVIRTLVLISVVFVTSLALVVFVRQQPSEFLVFGIFQSILQNEIHSFPTLRVDIHVGRQAIHHSTCQRC